MNPAIEISLCLLAWLITLIHIQTVFTNRVWKKDPIAFRVWVATLFFALTLTFLVTPISNAINHLTFPNFSRLLAYSSVSITLYLTASSFLVTFPTAQNQHQLKFLKPYLVVTLVLLLGIYAFFVSRTPEWEELPIPGTAAEMTFKLVLFTYATGLCVIMAVACYRYLDQEKVTVTKYRILAIILTAVGGAAFFFTKSILALSYLWRPLGADWIHMLSKMMMVGTAMLWGGAFLHNQLYARVLDLMRGARYWPAYRDLLLLVEAIERLCPPVGMPMSKPTFLQFVRSSDYHLYRAIVHILDGKTMIADFLDDTLPINQLKARWDEHGYLDAMQMHSVLRSAAGTEDYGEMISAYRLASKKLIRSNT